MNVARYRIKLISYFKYIVELLIVNRKKMSNLNDKYDDEKNSLGQCTGQLWSSYSPNFKYPRGGLVAPGFKCGWTFHKTWHSSWLEHALKSLCSQSTLLSESQDYLCETSSLGMVVSSLFISPQNTKTFTKLRIDPDRVKLSADV